MGRARFEYNIPGLVGTLEVSCRASRDGTLMALMAQIGAASRHLIGVHSRNLPHLRAILW
jgi:hypothetical protein